MSHWRIDPGVARDLADVVGWDPGDGPVALTRALAARVPAGSTAKLAAVAAGEVPPGADAEAVARRIVADRAAGRPEPSWACWPRSTVMAALLVTLAGAPATVVALRRIDASAPPVDLHSLVVVDGLLCDTYFASVVAGPGAEEVERTVGGVWCRRIDEPDGRWRLFVGNGRWGQTLDYRMLAPVVDPGDVAAFCAVSTAHTGLPTRPTAFVWRAADLVETITHADGTTATRSWTWDPADPRQGVVDQAEHPDWPAATDDFKARTGIPLL
ncbi:MAG TPA: hypothetical protein VF228_07555 [Iamia sp.]